MTNWLKDAPRECYTVKHLIPDMRIQDKRSVKTEISEILWKVVKWEYTIACDKFNYQNSKINSFHF